MKRLVRILAIGVAVLFFAAVGLCSFLSSRSRALAAYIATLRTHGEKVTFVELAGTYSRDTDQASASLTNVVARLGPPPIEVWTLSLAPNRSRVRWDKDPLTEVLADTGGTNICTVSWADLDRQVADAGPALQELRRILQSPPPNHGFRHSYFVPLIWKEKRRATDWLACAALLHLRDGDSQKALSSIRAVTQLADFHREEFLLAEQMTRIAIAGTGIELTWEALQCGGWNDEQLASLQQSWGQFDFLAALVKALEGERAMPLELMAMLRSPSFRAQSKMKMPQTATQDIWAHASRFPEGVLENDVLYALRHIQGTLKLARQLHDGTPFNQVMALLEEHQAKIDAKSRSATRFFYLVSLIGMLDLSKAVERPAQVETLRRLTVIAIALRRHELKHGRLPTSLDALVPEFLPAIPRDCMDGRNLKYRVNLDRTFSLYSAGPDGRDNGGDPTPLKPGAGFGMGRDTVWPTALRPLTARHHERTTQ